MTQENKELLLKDLCSRLPYGVILEHEGNLSKLDTIFMCDFISISSTSMDNKLSYNLNLDEVKPYLYPLSSMTDEQEEEYNNLNCYELGCFPHTEEALDYLIRNHFDYRYLIDEGLAIDCTNLNIY